jgi:hypothetical protein
VVVGIKTVARGLALIKQSKTPKKDGKQFGSAYRIRTGDLLLEREVS